MGTWPAIHVGERGRGALVLHGVELGPAHGLQQFHAQMRPRADTQAAVIDPARLVPGRRDQVAEVLHRERRMHHQGLADADETADRDEILRRIVRKLAVEIGIDGEGVLRGQQQRVAIGRRPCDRRRSNLIVGAALVLDHNRLPPFLGQPLRQGTRDNVGRSARSQGYDDGDRLARIGLSMRGGCGHPDACERQGNAKSFH
jgi:hypothetical protein